MSEQLRHAIGILKEARIDKKKAGYIEIDEFKTSDLKHNFCCYNCVFFLNVQGGRCLIVHNHGEDSFGKKSDIVAPYGYCRLWEPNWAVMNEKD